MPSKSHHRLIFLLALSSAVLIKETRASSHSAQQPDFTAYAFVRKSSNDDNEGTYDSNSNSHNQSNNESSPQRPKQEEEESSIVASSLLYDGGCVVSAEALMCTGGDGYDNFFPLMNFGDDDDEEESDDDDDDDDDGHSSMLSNASIRRSKVHVGGASREQSQSTRHSNHKDDDDDGMVASNSNRKSPSWSLFHAKPRHKRVLSSASPHLTTSTSTSTALSMRGGAAAAGVVSNLGSEFAKKLFVTALVTLVYEGMIGHVLEFVKIAMQTSPDGTSYGEVIKSITSQKGIAGLWDGFIPWGVVQSIFKGSVFGLAHAIALSFLKPLADKGTIPTALALTLAGGIGGGFQGYVLSPTLLLKTRVMTNPVFRQKMSLWQTTCKSATIGYDVVATEGVGALMKGSGIFATKRVCDWASRYYFSDLFETLAIHLKGGAPLTVGEKASCSLLGGTASTIVTLPLDVLVAKIQDAKKAGVRVSALKLFQDELKEKGWRGLKNSYMQGFGVRLLHVAFTTVAIKTGTPIAYDLLFPTVQES